MPAVRHAHAADIPQLIRTLTSAFREDPVTCWMFDEAGSRLPKLTRWMGFVLEVGLTRGHLYAAAEGKAVSLWSAPDVNVFDDHSGARMVSLLQELIGERAGSVLGPLARVLGLRPITKPHFYLFMLGTHAEHQGQGLGARVLDPVLGRCDEQAIPAYLESSNPRNLPFYRRHGFEIVERVPLAENGPVLHTMWRPPSPRPL
jgi:ribosomal protein S18 acetylase RimI-like enzyme